MSDKSLVNWLESATELGMLPRDILESIASELVELVVPAGQKVTLEDTPVKNLYILESGQAERYRRKQPGLMWASGLLPGAIVNLSAFGCLMAEFTNQITTSYGRTIFLYHSISKIRSVTSDISLSISYCVEKNLLSKREE